MENRWTSNINPQKPDEEVVIEKTTMMPEESNTSKKMGIAMGVVGVLLVLAGVVPMFFDTSELQGDTTKTAQEEIDPLVALLSGTSAPSPVATKEAVDPLVALLSGTSEPTGSPAGSAVPVASSAVLAASSSSPMASVMPTLLPSPVASSEVQKILEKKNAELAVNNNTGKTDKEGMAFHDAALSNTSVVATPSTKPAASDNKPVENVSAGPAAMPKTGAESTLFLLGISFLIVAFWSRRKSFL